MVHSGCVQVSHKSNVRLADEQDARLQYLSWRVWGMKRRHATVELHKEAEQAELDDSDLSETRSEELTGPVIADAEEVANLVRSAPTPALPRLSVQAPAAAAAPAAADVDVYDSDDRDNLFSPVAPGSPAAGELVVHTTLTADRVPKLYCVLISMHGLVRGDAMELGKDPDTGGQVRAGRGPQGGGGGSRCSWERSCASQAVAAVARGSVESSGHSEVHWLCSWGVMQVQGLTWACGVAHALHKVRLASFRYMVTSSSRLMKDESLSTPLP